MARTPSRRTKRPQASDRVRVEWLRRVEAEYRSAAITQNLGLWLIQIGAPPELVSMALRIVADEMTHAEMSHTTFTAAGGTGAPSLSRETLCLSRSAAPLEYDVLRTCAEVFCLGETIAVRLFKRLRQRCTVPPARRALDRVLRDEVRHRDFGWTLLEWLFVTPLAPELRKLLDAELAGMLGRVRRNYAAPPGAESAFPDADRAWGLMPLVEYRQAVEETFVRDYTPRFRGLGVKMP